MADKFLAETSLANGMVSLHNAAAGSGCGWLVNLTSTNQPGNFMISGPMAVNSCSSGLVLDNQPSSVGNMTAPQMLPRIFSP
jgi:hypothetical protein